jgi:hypothetical protein
MQEEPLWEVRQRAQVKVVWEKVEWRTETSWVWRIRERGVVG